ncbi:MAG: hypothetical protein IMW98_04200 [Firmicutes bacterium]|nr:hypothetical protein [Bacillota bacterium]
MALITIAGTPIVDPSEIKLGYFDLTKSSRTASGRMVMEIVATKRRLDLTWQKIADADLQAILDVIAAHKPFFVVTFPVPGGTASMTAYVGDINTGLWYTVGGVRWWQDVSFALIEQ